MSTPHHKHTADNEVLLQWLDEHLKALNLVDTMTQPNGFNRLGYTPEEAQSMAVFKRMAQALGLQVRRDQAGNLIARWEPTEGDARMKPAVATGSHVDTVKNGGGYDGVAGVLCALGAIKQLQDDGYAPSKPIEVICFASEESSRFGISTIGSKAMAGNLPVEEIQHVTDQEGTSIREAVETSGLSWEHIQEAERSSEDLSRFIELHIEQGTRIEEAGADFGVVTAIACPIRLKIQVEGKTAHTGTTPMDRRQDALVAVAPLISFISEQARALSEEHATPLVATASTLDLQPNAMTAVPGWVELGVDIRSVDDQLKEQMVALITQKCEQLEPAHHVRMKIDTLVHNPSVRLSTDVADRLKAQGEALGYKPYVLESGAGHDAMNMAHKWPSSMLFIPCEDGLSHHPEEHASLEDLNMGAQIIAAYLRQETSDRT
ncbi:M20 family metallo-hydrolase [Caldalkalibacillus salinus]|uniref:M20 family metallo-hydrolase n=1 Tax=Caldalkalibacillus salinus TaxID=2803787 RepID=UPI001922E2CE|nr:M20 family metallo-hydrolase [Caldalkalibacillus salinus]